MNSAKKCLVLIVLFALIDLHCCGRYGGSRGGGGGGRGGGRRPTSHTTRRPYTTQRSYSSTSRSYGSTTSRSQYNSGTTSRSNYQSTTRRNYQSSTQTPVGWNNLPPKPGSTYTTGQSPQNIKIVNKYNYHYPGHYSLPVQNPSHPGYFYSPSSYHYGLGDTGSTALGFFLGYSLAKVTTPTFSHYSFYDGYRPRYDHYEVHHYYHNKDSVPPKQDIAANSIVGCVGDTVTVCPANTTSLCTSSGALMCVVSATTTVPCLNNQQVNCVTSSISCVNNTAPECKGKDSTTINIPCISNAKVEGDVKTVNNTIIATNSSTTTENSTTTPGSVRRKRETAQNFCVTVLAVPAPKKETEGEIVLKDATSIVEKFFETAFNV